MSGDRRGSEAVNLLSTKVWFLCTAKLNHPMMRAWPRWVTSTATARIATGRNSFSDAIKGWPHRVTLKNAASAEGITTVHCAPVCRNSDLDLPRYGPPERLVKTFADRGYCQKKVAQPNKLGRGFCLARQRRETKKAKSTHKKRRRHYAGSMFMSQIVAGRDPTCQGRMPNGEAATILGQPQPSGVPTQGPNRNLYRFSPAVPHDG